MQRYGADDEDLVEFAFVSRAAEGLPASVFLRLARQSWSFNARMGLTGELILDGGRFVQVIEGDCAIVQALAARVVADRRHEAIEVRAFGRLAARRHVGWSLVGFGFEPPVIAVQPVSDLPFLPPSRPAVLAAQGVVSF